MPHLLPERVSRPVTCVVCGARFPGGPLEEVSICSIACFVRDQGARFNAPRPPGGPDDSRPWLDFLEERRQRSRELRLVRAMVCRYRLGGNPDRLEDEDWLELAEADLGNYRRGDVARRIDELVRMYNERARRHPEVATMTEEAARVRLWAMVPTDMAQRITS